MAKLNWSALLPTERTFTGWGWWFIGYVMVPACAVIAVVRFTPAVPQAWDASHGAGTRGVLHVTSKECGDHRFVGYTCDGLNGYFVSADGRTRENGVFFNGVPSGIHTGSTIRVRYLGGEIVYPNGRNLDWLWDAVCVVVGVLAMGCWVWIVRRQLLGRRMPWDPR